jgi:uncharacterized membrane protein YphA (DoxX/SURF4 family)
MTTAAPPASLHPTRAFTAALWIAQVLLAAMFGAAGAMKSTMPIATLAENMVWPGDLPALLVRFIGVSELAAGIGLLLPALTRVKPGLTPLAAAGLVVVMALAAIFHIMRGEWASLPINIILGGIAAFVAWGRTSRAPIEPR